MKKQIVVLEVTYDERRATTPPAEWDWGDGWPHHVTVEVTTAGRVEPVMEP